MTWSESTRRSFLKQFGVAGAVALMNSSVLPEPHTAGTLVLQNRHVRRDLKFDGKAWRTVRFARANGADSVEVESDEFHLLFMGDEVLTISDFVADGNPQIRDTPAGRQIAIRYKRLDHRNYPQDAPDACVILYWAAAEESWLRKKISFEFAGSATVDRLEVERFSVKQKSERGGRGEPVFVDGTWFFGLEYPASHSRHTDGNTPAPDSAHFEKVGNYSFIDLAGRDREPDPRPGLLRLMHFPGYAKQTASGWTIESKSAVAGVGNRGEAIDQAFFDYLATVQKAPRTFTLYNNWFDPNGKNLSGNHLIDVYNSFTAVLDSYSVKLDAMVPDSGWQDRRSVYMPNPRYFPGGMADLARLGESLQSKGTSLGLWMALDDNSSDIAWGEANGYQRAQPNDYFKRFSPYYTLSGVKYHEALRDQIRRLVRECRLSYFKHDFNHLSDIGEGHGHPPTDRHGHEACVDVMIETLGVARQENQALYQNLTNWMWFSPWWLMHGDALWMLAGDDGFNGNYPELSTRAMATTDRDTYLWRMWGEPLDRPLLPVSRLMTHGIIRNPRGQMESPQDTVQDWSDHVMMYYGRGVQMREWYITPAAMNADYWKALCTIHRWGERQQHALRNTMFVGGRPDEGNAYGYIGWDGEHGVLVVRNPAPAAQTLSIPFDGTTLFRGRSGRDYCARVVYPYRDAWPATFRSGAKIEIEIPGYSTMAFELEPGKATGKMLPLAAPAIDVKTDTAARHASFVLPDEAMRRCDLLLIGYPVLPTVKIGESVAVASRSSAGAINHFAGYARSGMPSAKARMWHMASFDLTTLRGRQTDIEFIFDAANATQTGTFEAWLLMERPVEQTHRANSGSVQDLPWPISDGFRRQTIRVVAEVPDAYPTT